MNRTVLYRQRALRPRRTVLFLAAGFRVARFNVADLLFLLVLAVPLFLAAVRLFAARALVPERALLAACIFVGARTFFVFCLVAVRLFLTGFDLDLVVAADAA